ncbi:MAG: hypothetical protein V1492_06200 [Candidatus Micrarchaeota archaeon]
MNAGPQTSDALNHAWKKTCTLLFGEDIGDLEGYSTWLSGLIDTNMIKKSSISGKNVAFSVKEYAPDSKWISFDEIDFNKKFEPLNINEIKDMDSIVEAISDRNYYCGNIILGNSAYIERCSNLTDCFYASDSAQYTNSKYIAFCTVGRDSSYCFGVHGPGDTDFCIRCTQTFNVKRSFELWVRQNCSDCYYVYDLDSCSNCLFSFHLRNKNYCIGNLELDRDKYLKIKNKLSSELVEELKKHKSLPSLLDIMKKSKHDALKLDFQGQREEKLDKTIVEKGFSGTTRILFGKKLSGMDDYEKWLTAHSHKMLERRSVISGKKILFLPYITALVMADESLANRIVTAEEAIVIGEKFKVSPAEAEAMTLKNVHESIGKLAYVNVDFRIGECSNLVDCSVAYASSNCYRASAIVSSKDCGCGMWPKDSTNCFGFDTLFDSSFCINCYHSVKLSRCFELDACRNCSDSYFSHNCENVHDSMFCFNTKNAKHALGNAQLEPTKYKGIKQALLEQIAEELEDKKNLKWNIYNIGCEKS